MPDVININNIYQLLAFLIVAGLQIWTKREVNKLANQQAKIKAEIETTRTEMFHLVKTNGHTIGAEGYSKGLAATIEAALRVAYLMGKADVKEDAPYPEQRVRDAAVKLAEVASQGQKPGDVPKS